MLLVDQKRLYTSCLNYLKKLKKSNIEISLSGLTYFCTWSKTIGYYKAVSLITGNKIKLYYEILKNIIKIGYFSNYKLDSNFKTKNKNLFIAWSSNQYLNKNFLQSDRYISGFKKERKKGSWFLIHQDDHKKKNNLKDVYLLKREKTYFNLFYLIKILIFECISKKLNLYKIFNELNTESIFSKIVYKNFNKIIKKNNIKKIIFSYEAQPFQKYLIKNIKKNFKQIKIYCDIHSIQPSYIHLIDLEYKSDYYISHHKDQRNFMIENLNLNPKKILFKKIRISKTKKEFLGKIFLPYSFENPEKVVEHLKFLEMKKIINLSRYKLCPHPIALRDAKYNNNYLEIKKNLYKNNTIGKKVIIVGNTNILFEALDLKMDIIHIILDEISDKICPFFWKNIKTFKIHENIFKYTS